MNSNYFIKIMFVGFIIFAPILAYTVFFTDPGKGSFQLVAFFISLFASILCLFSLGLYAIKKKATNNEVVFASIKSSIRQSFFFAIFAVAIFGMAMIKLLTWWDAMLLAMSLILLELYFKSDKVVS